VCACASDFRNGSIAPEAPRRHAVTYRVGLIVPSSNTTMETELPAILSTTGCDFSFHSSRVRMTTVSPEGLSEMVDETRRAAQEIDDARCDIVVYACLIAVMAKGPGAHRTAERDISKVLSACESGSPPPVVSSAGALIEGIRALNARRVAIITPYITPLTERVITYLAGAGIEVTDSVSLEISDNLEVGRIGNERLLGAVSQLSLNEAEALVLSACVQMPSLALVQQVQVEYGLPVLTAATATARQILDSLGMSPSVPNAVAGALLA
jgi:maleate isomerase